MLTGSSLKNLTIIKPTVKGYAVVAFSLNYVDVEMLRYSERSARSARVLPNFSKISFVLAIAS